MGHFRAVVHHRMSTERTISVWVSEGRQSDGRLGRQSEKHNLYWTLWVFCIPKASL